MDRRKWKIKESSAEQRRITLKRMVRLGSVMKALSKKKNIMKIEIRMVQQEKILSEQFRIPTEKESEFIKYLL